jgi:hypothetical protein
MNDINWKKEGKGEMRKERNEHDLFRRRKRKRMV